MNLTLLGARGCYICRPGDPGVADEGCASCESSYVKGVALPEAVASGHLTEDEAAQIARELDEPEGAHA